jgi:hypothetical protein
MTTTFWMSDFGFDYCVTALYYVQCIVFSCEFCSSVLLGVALHLPIFSTSSHAPLKFKDAKKTAPNYVPRIARVRSPRDQVERKLLDVAASSSRKIGIHRIHSCQSVRMRKFSQLLALLAILAMSTSPFCAHAAVPNEGKVEHFVVLMLENRFVVYF